LHLVVASQPFVRHALQHEIAPLARAIGVTARIVVRRASNLGDQQRELVQLELGERFAEVKLARESEAVNGASAILAQVDLVDVCVQQIALVVTDFERHGHERFAQLARPRALVRQEVAPDQLLRQRARAFANLAGRHVDEQRARHGDGIDPEVAIEPPVLDGLQRVGQQRRNLAGRDDEPVFAVRREQAADQDRVQPDDRRGAAARVA
jgi:hypothetical protein